MNIPQEFPVSVRDIVISDPCILPVKEEKRYFVYARWLNTSLFPEVDGSPSFYAFESPDLIHWSRPYRVFEKGDFWADLDYWAPEVHAYRGKYYLVSSFRARGTFRRCQFLVSDSPRGPFVPLRQEPVTPENWHCLDGTLYVDLKGQPWMVFCHEWLQVNDGQICAVPLSEDLSKAIGDPVILFRATDAPWRTRRFERDRECGFVTDGPWLYRMKDGTLIMLWSNYSEYGYTTGYARSRFGDIMGPWDQEEVPLYAMDGAHSMLFHTFEGELMMCLHCNNNAKEKRIHLFQMEEKNGGLHIVNEVTGNWYRSIRGMGERYHYEDECLEEPVFTKVCPAKRPY